MYLGIAQRRKPNWTGSKVWMARDGLIFTLPANVILFLSSLSPCAWPHTSLPCLGRSGGSGEETPGNKTMEGPCQLSAFAWSLLPSCYITSGWIISIPAGGDSSTNLLTLSFFCANTVMERTRSWDSVHVIKTDPRAKQSRLYISSYFQKDLGCIYLPLKCECHLLLERCITGAKDADPEANIQQGEKKKLQTYQTTHSFLFSNQFLPCKTKISYFLQRHRNQQQIEIYLLRWSNICSCVIFACRVPYPYIKGSSVGDGK